MPRSVEFRKHGLILDKASEALYKAAHIAVQKDLELNPKEHETTALMFHLLEMNVFAASDSRYTGTAEYYLDTTKGKQADIVCKRTLRTTGSHLKKLEWQAYRYCQIYFQSVEGRELDHIFAATMVGAHMRIWRCEKDPAFVPQREVEPGKFRAYWTEIATRDVYVEPDANWGRYQDVGLDRNNVYFLRSFAMIKDRPLEPMTTDDQFGENRMKKYFGDKYGNPGCLTSESREVRDLTENMGSLGGSSGANFRLNRNAKSSYTSLKNTPSRVQMETTRNAPYPSPSNRPSESSRATSFSRIQEPIRENRLPRREPIRIAVELQNILNGRRVRMFENRSTGQKYYYSPGDERRR
ncbi:5958642b-7227-4070-a86b-3292ac887d73 [Sclerotinia trifoliorum]|uniref:5958642b-7227-4070-a86b-3292ac887d73 n=1 Tax=Sclerotinia trifoliorum TaxID=28548 RepID=A0A8H2ZQ29_9HELO|nr:5958642b-7227-4070-a86b-3292ac887d73 [Sclerotinia trifoliorum]